LKLVESLAREAPRQTWHPDVHDAIDTIVWFAGMVSAKVNRALHGLAELDEDIEDSENPIQNDWNGSAKIALISIERSEQAWRTIAQAAAGETPAAVADQLGELRKQVEAGTRGGSSGPASTNQIPSRRAEPSRCVPS
jgi:hypothetical protein